MNIALRYAARSDVGLVRSNNQDSGYAGPNLIAVADGMGGHAGGDVASSLAIAAIAPLDATEHTPDDALTDLEAAIERARQDLVDASEVDPQLAGMGTTVTAILRTGSTLVMAHLGDSRAYLLHDGELAQVTTDHTFVQHLVDTGRITADEAETHPQRNVVMRVLGDFDIDLTPDMSVREAKAGDRWMLCSDGLSGFVDPGTIAKTMTDTPDVAECAERLLQLALYAGSTDNVTVVVADVVDLDGPAAAGDEDDSAAGASAIEIVGSAATPEDLPESVRTTADRAPARAERADGDTDAEASSATGAVGDDDDPTDDDARPGRAPRRWVTLVAVALLVVGLGVAVWAAYGWTQQQYYVGVSDGQVAVFRGVPESAGPVTLSTPVELTGARVEDLPGYVVDRLESTIPADSRADALERANRLIADAAQESEPTEDPTDEPSRTTTDDPTDEPTDDPSSTATTDAPTEEP